MPGYDGSLLRLAVELTDRLLPAFDTPTGVPLSWVNLRKVGSAACAFFVACFLCIVLSLHGGAHVAHPMPFLLSACQHGGGASCKKSRRRIFQEMNLMGLGSCAPSRCPLQRQVPSDTRITCTACYSILAVYPGVEKPFAPAIPCRARCPATPA